MMLIDKFINDDQDPKAVEKVLGKLGDLLSSQEELLYIAVQKRPAVNLMPDCIVLSNKRLFYCEPANFGITMNFKDISWKTIKEVSFKEELFGAKFICVPQHGENIVTEFIPKVQARKLYQATKEQLEQYKEEVRQSEKTENLQVEKVESQLIEKAENQQAENNVQAETVEMQTPITEIAPAPQQILEEPEDETTLKLRKLKALFDKQLITQEEYEAKKASILDSF